MLKLGKQTQGERHLTSNNRIIRISAGSNNRESTVSNFYDSISSFMLQPLILQPTRVCERSQSLIDNIFLNNSQYNSISGSLTCKISDHFPQFSILQNFNCTKKKTPKFGRSFRTFNENEFLLVLNRIDWDKIFGNITCQDQLIDRFLKTLNEVLDIMALVKKLSKKEASLKVKPWITKGIITQ